jgi:hypothetical protein
MLLNLMAGIIVSSLLYFSSKSLFHLKDGIGEAYSAYKYLYQCNNHCHWKTLHSIFDGAREYYSTREKNMTSRITRTGKNTYALEYQLTNNKTHKIEVTVHRGPSSVHSKPSVESIY